MAYSTSDSSQLAPQRVPLARHAALLSVFSFLLFLIVSSLARRLGLGLSADLIGLALFLLGFAAAVFALIGIRRHGRKGILIPALIGLLLNGFMLSVWAGNFAAARAESEQTSSQPEP